MWFVCAALCLAAAAGTTLPRLFAVQNWEKTEGGGPLPTVTRKSWRLVEVDISSGALKSITSWKGGLIPNHGDSTGLLVGAGYNEDSDKRNQLLVQESEKSGVLKCYDADKGKSCPDSPCPNAEYLEENNGFFTYMSMDDVRPDNSIFSLYDALNLDSPAHFATVNTSQTTGAMWMTQNWGVNEVQQVIYAVADSKFYRVQRITGEVKEMAFKPQAKDTSSTVTALFVDPAASGEKLLVLLSVESYNHSSTLYEHDVVSGKAELLLELPGLYPGPAVSHCKAFDKATRTLYLGCDPVFAVSLATKKVVSTTHVQTTPAGKSGTYSIGGIVALPASSTRSIEFV